MVFKFHIKKYCNIKKEKYKRKTIKLHHKRVKLSRMMMKRLPNKPSIRPSLEQQLPGEIGQTGFVFMEHQANIISLLSLLLLLLIYIHTFIFLNIIYIFKK